MMHFNVLLAACLPLACVHGCVIPESTVQALDAQPAHAVQTSEQQRFLAASPDPGIWDDESNPISCKKVCPLARTVNNKRHHNKHIWNKAEVDGWLSIWLKAVAYKRWPERVAKNIWPHKVVDIHCADMHSTECGPVTTNCCKKTCPSPLNAMNLFPIFHLPDRFLSQMTFARVTKPRRLG